MTGRSELQAGEKLLLSELCSMRKLNGAIYANNEYFAHLFGISKRTVRRWIASLEKFGYIKIRHNFIFAEGKISRIRQIIP
jgi:DNA-binding FadR family transcriptional regulator